MQCNLYCRSCNMKIQNCSKYTSSMVMSLIIPMFRINMVIVSYRFSIGGAAM